MSEDVKPYGIAYIASAPQEIRVGDKIVVNDNINVDPQLFGRQGIVTQVNSNHTLLVKIGDCSYILDEQSVGKIDRVSSNTNPLDVQVGGSHYKDMAIQPVEFCMKNNLDFCTSSAIKYLCRRKNKNGKQDLEKAKHFIDLLIKLEYPDPDFENVV